LPGPSLPRRDWPALLIGGDETRPARAAARERRVGLPLRIAEERRCRADRTRVAPRWTTRLFEPPILVGVLEAGAQIWDRRGLRVRDHGRKHGCAGAGQRNAMGNGTPHENILAPQARLMVNGCKTRMVNGALRSPLRAFPC
jgi:hypothetical protein